MTSKSSQLWRNLAAVLGLLLLSSIPAHAEDDYLSEEAFFEEPLAGGPPINDPLEPLNRTIFHFNDFVYLRVMKPVGQTYETVTTDTIRQGVGNFFRNLNYPIRLAGNVLQGRWSGALRETQRFAINTTAGVGGIFEVANSMEGFEQIPPEDVAQAFGSWGIGEGLYLVVPVLGPSNPRNLAGILGDFAVHPMIQPFSVIDHWRWEHRTALWGTEVIDRTPGFIDAYIQMKGSAIDPYISVRDAATQRWRAAIEE